MSYPPEQTSLSPLSIVTFEGTARSGKGTTVRATYERLRERSEKVLVIDQGQKFRSLAHLALRQGIDMEQHGSVDEFLCEEQTPTDMRQVLEWVSNMADDERDAELYTHEMSHYAGRIGRSDFSHGLAIELMHGQVVDAHKDGLSVVLIDGRTIEGHARQTPPEIGKVIFSAHFSCDSLIAARRVEKLFGNLDELQDDEKLRLLRTADGISERNASDMARRVDPLRKPSHALNFTYERYKPGDTGRVIDKCLEVDAKDIRLMVDTTRTESIDQMTEPLVEIILDALDGEREIV